MEKINKLFSNIDKVRKKVEETRKKESNLIDKLHDAILEEILKGNLFNKLKWRIPRSQYKSPMIQSIDATKDDNWYKIEKLLEKANTRCHTSVISLTDTVALDITGEIVSLLPRTRLTKADTIKCGEKYIEFMNSGLLSFVKKYDLKIDFSEIQIQKQNLLKDVKTVEQIIKFCEDLNKWRIT